MMAALPATAPAKPQRARKVLVLAATRGFVHSSIPLAAKMVEEMGKKTGAWTDRHQLRRRRSSLLRTSNSTTAIFLDSTTGTFLDDPNDQAVTDARRKALMEFVRGGKGMAGIHAASDSYHGDRGRARGRSRCAAQPARPAPSRRRRQRRRRRHRTVATGGGTPAAGQWRRRPCGPSSTR